MRIDPINFIILLIFEIKQILKFIFIPNELFLHPNNPVIIIKFIFLIFSLIFEHL